MYKLSFFKYKIKQISIVKIFCKNENKQTNKTKLTKHTKKRKKKEKKSITKTKQTNETKNQNKNKTNTKNKTKNKTKKTNKRKTLTNVLDAKCPAAFTYIVPETFDFVDFVFLNGELTVSAR